MLKTLVSTLRWKTIWLLSIQFFKHLKISFSHLLTLPPSKTKKVFILIQVNSGGKVRIFSSTTEGPFQKAALVCRGLQVVEPGLLSFYAGHGTEQCQPHHRPAGWCNAEGLPALQEQLQVKRRSLWLLFTWLHHNHPPDSSPSSYLQILLEESVVLNTTLPILTTFYEAEISQNWIRSQKPQWTGTRMPMFIVAQFTTAKGGHNPSAHRQING